MLEHGNRPSFLSTQACIGHLPPYLLAILDYQELFLEIRPVLAIPRPWYDVLNRFPVHDENLKPCHYGSCYSSHYIMPVGEIPGLARRESSTLDPILGELSRSFPMLQLVAVFHYIYGPAHVLSFLFLAKTLFRNCAE